MNILIITYELPILWPDFAMDIKESGNNVDIVHYKKDESNNIINKTKSNNYDLIIVIKGEYVESKTIKEIKICSDAKIVLWIIDDPYLRWSDCNGPTFNKIAAKCYKEYDKIYIFDTFYKDRLINSGFRNTHYLPFAYSPLYYKNVSIDNKLYDISFLGRGYKSRAKILMKLLKYNIFIAGVNWKNDELINRVIKSSVIMKKRIIFITNQK